MNPVKPMIRFLWSIVVLCLVSSAAVAQDATPEVTPPAPDVNMPTAEVTPEATAEFPQPGTFSARRQVQGYTRAFLIYIPEMVMTASEPVPLVIALHGAGGSGAGMQGFAALNDVADDVGFMVLYPDSLQVGWNDHRLGESQAIDDVQFLQELISYFTQNLNADPNRVYLAGFSRGGMMAFRAACDMPDQIAGIVSVASTFPRYLVNRCRDSAPVAVMMIQGTQDSVVPYDGALNYYSAAESVTYWTQHNGCDGDPEVTTLDASADDPTSVEIVQYTACAAEVTLVTITGGGHVWPSEYFPSSQQLGQSSREIDAAQTAWDFFSRNARQ